MKYKASLITSMFNASEDLDMLIKDVLRQTFFTECEWIVMDANSDYKDYEILKPIADKHENIKLYKLEEDKGVYDTWNKCIEASTGEYITNWNCDDRRAAWCLERQIITLDENPEVDLVYNRILETFVANETFESNTSYGEWTCLDFSVENMMKVNSPHNCPMWRKSLHERHGFFDTKYKICADYDMWLRAAFGGSEFLKIDEILSLYYRSPDGVSTKKSSINLALKEIQEIRSKF